jgi:hypothetical protein
MEKKIGISLLLDFYGPSFLLEKQRDIYGFILQ